MTKLPRRRLFSDSLSASCSALVMSLAATGAFAQAVPSITDPSQVIRRIDENRLPQQPVDIEIQRQGDETTATGGSVEKAFTLQSVQLQGSTVYKSGEMESVYGPYVGQPVSFADLQAIANAMTAKYRADGYILSRVVLPPQKISGGVVTFQAVEGYVSDVQVNGEISGDGELLNDYAAKIKEQRPLKAETLERYLLLMDDLPGVTARSVLQAAAEGTGASVLAVQVGHNDFEGDIEFDNRGNRFLGPYQITGVAAFNSLFGNYERNTFRVLSTAEFEEVLFGEYTYEHQLGTEGSRLSGRVAYSEVQPGSSLEPFNIEGETKLFEARYLHPWVRTRNENLNFTSNFRVQDSENDVLGFNIYKDHVRVLSVGIEYDIVDDLGGVNQFDFDINQGLSMLDATKDGLGRSRAVGEHNFTSATATLTRIQEITDTWSLYLSSDAQYTADSLLTSEQFSLGGRQFGRAYDGAELLGDKGVSGLIEVRYGDFYDLEGFLKSYQLYAFYDIGSVWLNETLVGEEARESLSSTGIGARVNLAEDISGGVELAIPLTRDVSSEGDDDPRIFFNIVKRF